MLNHPASLFNIDTHEDKINLPAQKSPCTDYSTQHRLCGLLPFCLSERFRELSPAVGSAIADHAGKWRLLFHAVVRNSGPYRFVMLRPKNFF